MPVSPRLLSNGPAGSTSTKGLKRKTSRTQHLHNSSKTWGQVLQGFQAALALALDMHMISVALPAASQKSIKRNASGMQHEQRLGKLGPGSEGFASLANAIG